MFHKEERNMRALSLPTSLDPNQTLVVYHGTTCDAFPRDRSKDSSLRVGRYMLEKDDYLTAKKRSPQKRDLDRIFGCCKYKLCPFKYLMDHISHIASFIPPSTTNGRNLGPLGVSTIYIFETCPELKDR